jgi:hypothetical protein
VIRVVQGARWYFIERQAQQVRDETVGNQLKASPEEYVSLFLREILQNSLDARIKPPGDGDPDLALPVSVDFEILKVEGDNLRQLREAIGAEELDDHLNAIYRASDGQPSRVARRALAEGPLTVVRIVETNTTGLTGGEDSEVDPGPFSRLTKDQFEKNPNEEAGGSYGVGKSVLWKFNLTKTVLFATRVPTEPGGTARTRFIGRTELRNREIGQRKFQGSGWFCGGHGHATDSIWDLAEEQLGRLCFKTGCPWNTQILILGLDPKILPDMDCPDNDDPQNLWTDTAIDTLVVAMQESVAKWFWPAIVKGRLLVTINGISVDAKGWASQQGFYQALTGDSLRGERVNKNILLKVPRLQKPPSYPEVKQEVNLGLYKLGEGNTSVVALFRYPGMVVKYEAGPGTRGEGHWVGTLPCGTFEGNHEDIGAKALQYFLRMAEDETHGQWTSTSHNLLEKYPLRGPSMTPRSALNHLHAELRKGVEELVIPPVVTTPSASSLFRDFKLPGKGPTGGKHLPRVEKLAHNRAEGRVTVRITPRSHNAISLDLRRPLDNGHAETVGYFIENVSGATWDGSLLRGNSTKLNPVELDIVVPNLDSEVLQLTATHRNEA